LGGGGGTCGSAGEVDRDTGRCRKASLLRRLEKKPSGIWIEKGGEVAQGKEIELRKCSAGRKKRYLEPADGRGPRPKKILKKRGGKEREGNIRRGRSLGAGSRSPKKIHRNRKKNSKACLRVLLLPRPVKGELKQRKSLVWSTPRKANPPARWTASTRNGRNVQQESTAPTEKQVKRRNGARVQTKKGKDRNGNLHPQN